MEWRLFADLAEIAGERSIQVEPGPDATVGDALDELLDGRPELRERVLADDGSVRDHVNVLRNGENVHAGDGMDTEVAADDELALFPPVSGG